ncbi:MAG TPA: hypothetical protein VLG16_01770 [Candidatus Saccharimonadales bacterium]|nr:hypothetical protein [Candidatus Saccharimonadales bacterium]
MQPSPESSNTFTKPELPNTSYPSSPTNPYAEIDSDENWRDELLPEPDFDMTVFTRVPTAKERALAEMAELSKFFGVVDALQIEDLRAAQDQVTEKADWLIQSGKTDHIKKQIGKFLVYSDPEALATSLAGHGYFDVIARHFPAEVKQRVIPGIVKYL